MSTAVSTLEKDTLFPVVRMVQTQNNLRWLTARQLAILVVLRHEADGLTGAAIARKLGVSRPCVCKALISLGRTGFVSRNTQQTTRDLRFSATEKCTALIDGLQASTPAPQA